jgi:hypothetical protein
MFDAMLRELIDRVPGARGVIFCDPEGETVSCVGASGRHDKENLDDYDLKVTGAQLAGPLEQVILNASVAMGRMSDCVITGAKEKLVVHMLPQRYFLVLCLEPHALAARGLHHLQVTAVKIAEEI